MRSTIYSLLLSLLLLFFISPAATAGPKNKIGFKDITLTTSNSHLLFFALLHNSEQKELENALHSGIPMQFTFTVELQATNSPSNSDERIGMEFTHTLKYDTLKEQYQLLLEEQNNRTTTYKELDKAMQKMYEINGLKVIELTKLRPEGSYKIRIKALLYKKTLPMNLHYVIPFISLGDMETSWHTMEFSY